MKNHPSFFSRFVRSSLQVMAVAVLAFQTVPRAAAAAPVYIFATFSGDGAEDMKLRIYTSVDGINYSLYSITGYGGPTGSLRDPSIMKHTDGRYYMVFTAPPYNKPYAYQNFVGLAWSTDLQTWHTMPNISTTGIPGVKVSWAPEWVVDGSDIPKFIVNCSSANSDLRPYLYTATNRDLTSWSGPVDIGIGAMHLDTQVLKVGDTWHCFTKSKLLKHATGPSITGPWTWLPDRPDWANLEGPCAVQLTDGSWMMQVDPMYDVQQYMTSPDLITWSPLMYWPGMSNVKHGTVIRDDAFNLPPGGLAATPGNGVVTLQWNAFPGATSYTVKRASTSRGPFVSVANVIGTSFIDSKLANGTTYYYVISMNSGGVERTDSAPVSAVPFVNVVTLAHRYSFSETNGTTVGDSVGGPAWNGTLPNGGTLGGGQVRVRAAGSQYVQLPAGILSNYTAVTVEAWVTFPATLPNNCFFFGFGNASGASGSSYIFCQPKSGRIAITPTDHSSEQNTAPNPSGNWSNQTNLHVTAVFNPPQRQMALYVNGVLKAQNTSVTTPLSAIKNLFSYIGRSFYSGDPGIDFNLDEFRIYNGAFSSADVATTQSLGPDQVIMPTAAPSGVNASVLPLAAAAESAPTILTENLVELRETVSPQGFVHPGISCDAGTLAVMREKVIAGVSPWVDCFEGIRRTRFADPKRKPVCVRQIVNDSGISGFAHDAHLAWAQTILYIVTGNEEYRKLPVEIINWYGSRTEESFFPRYFTDSHIKIGKYVYTLSSAADILRATTPKDAQLAVTPAMIDALQKNCLRPIRENCIERNDYFMNQHSYAIMGFLASTILGDEVADYKRAVEWTTVNATTPNWGRNGSIKQQIRLVTRNDKTGEAVEPTLQLVEMGRDMPHAEGNLVNLLMMSKTIDFQKTKVDPVAGTVTDKADGVSPIRFLDDRLPKGVALYTKFNMGFGLPWIPTYSETDPNHPDYLARYDRISPRGRGSFGGGAAYYYFKGIGLDMEAGLNRYIKAGFDVTAAGREQARSGRYFDSLHNYGFDFWIGLPAAASDAAPDAKKARRALATVLPPLEVTQEGLPLEGWQFEYRFVDLSAHAQPGDIYPGSTNDIPLRVRRDADGTGYVRMAIKRDPRTMVVTGRVPRGSGLRVRSDAFVKLRFYRDEDSCRRGGDCLQELYVPNTHGEWVRIITGVDSPGLLYIQATTPAGSATIDFDRIEMDESAPLPITFEPAGGALAIPAFVGAPIEKVITVMGGSQSVALAAVELPAGAAFEATTGTLSWTPAADQTGDHTLYITARDGGTMRTLRVDIHVARDLQAALDFVARPYDPAQRYVAETERAFKAALAARDLAALRRAVDGLELVNPRLPDGTLDYRVASSPPERGVNRMADNDPFTFGGVWGFDKNVTMDFGNRFKVKCEAFRMLVRDGLPSRMLGAVVYGSNDRKHWRLLTGNKAVSSPDWQTLTVRADERNKPYRYLRLFMPATSRAIFEVAELRIVGERIEDPSPDYCVAYIAGYPDGSFRPEGKFTKAEAVSLLAGLVDDYTDKGAYDCAFVDVPRTAPYFDDVAYMSRKGFGNTWEQPVKFVAGDAAKRFHPEALMTRGELAAIMARMQGLKGNDGPAFKDLNADMPNAAEIRLAAREGWLTADKDGTFRPDAPVTRAEFVVAANRMTGRTRTEPPSEGMPSFSDVGSSYWAHDDIMKAATTYPVQAAPASSRRKTETRVVP
jgi:hypothetical protein